MKRSTAAVLRLLRDRETVSGIDALRELGVYRLGARIFELRQAGFDITCDRSTGYGVYRLRETRQLELIS